MKIWWILLNHIFYVKCIGMFERSSLTECKKVLRHLSIIPTDEINEQLYTVSSSLTYCKNFSILVSSTINWHFLYFLCFRVIISLSKNMNKIRQKYLHARNFEAQALEEEVCIFQMKRCGGVFPRQRTDLSQIYTLSRHPVAFKKLNRWYCVECEWISDIENLWIRFRNRCFSKILTYYCSIFQTIKIIFIFGVAI